MPAAAPTRRLVPADISSLGPVAEEVFDNLLQPAHLAQLLAGTRIATEPDNEPARTLYRRLAGDPIDAMVYDWSITAPAPTDRGNAP